MSMYDVGMGRRSANHVPLSPLSFLQRTAAVYPDRCAVRYGEREWSWAETYGRCRALADALRGRGVAKNDTVAVLCPNTPPAVEVSFGVPMAGAVLNMINTRLDAEMVAFILDHAEARFFIVDQSFAEVATEALEIAEVSPTVVFIEDDALEAVESFGEITYEELVAEGDARADWCRAEDEWDAYVSSCLKRAVQEEEEEQWGASEEYDLEKGECVFLYFGGCVHEIEYGGCY
ncbi:MAG TPA: hypothetical protein EYQ27_17310, partial [Gemmatimonadetes bacterium]|nr:hypothetical protein [Gemmatimonadota bacterium]